MSASTGPPDDDAFWRRPEGAQPTGPESGRPVPSPEATPYAGPPRVPPPPPDWRPPMIAQPPPPRSLPEQNLDALTEAEGSARTVTYGIGMIAGAIAVLLICLLCSRVLF